MSEDKPIFDFTKVSRVWARKWRELMSRGMTANAVLTGVPKQGISQDELLQVQFAKAEAMIEINQVEAERDVLVVEVLVSVPRTWLVPNAPEGIDWKTPSALDWLLEARYTQLFDELTEARQEPKN